MSNNPKLDILLEAYKSWGRNPLNIGIWLYNKILEESGSDKLPELQVGEILFYFCIQCGMDSLTKPLKCECGGTEFHRFGTQQGLTWRNRKFGDKAKYRTVR